jgi:hypothetical protein
VVGACHQYTFALDVINQQFCFNLHEVKLAFYLEERILSAFRTHGFIFAKLFLFSATLYTGSQSGSPMSAASANPLSTAATIHWLRLT